MDGSMNCCVNLIYMHDTVYYQSNMTCLTILIMNLHTPKCATFYISVPLANFVTIKGQGHK